MIMIMKMKIKIDRIDRPRSRQGHKYSKYKKCFRMMMLDFATFEAKFMKMLCNAKAELKKSVLSSS